jgi:hypothetical protein
MIWQEVDVGYLYVVRCRCGGFSTVLGGIGARPMGLAWGLKFRTNVFSLLGIDLRLMIEK